MNFYDLEPPNHAQRWRGYEPTPEREAQALEACLDMALRAEEKEDYLKRCISGEKVFYFDHHKALIPGHIYSETGMDEFKISGACEYHFDTWFKEEEDDAEVP